MIITAPGLVSINDAVNLAFNDQLWAASTIYDKFTQKTTSTGAAEVYPRLNMLPGLREWIGDRQVISLSQTTFTITNREFEETIGIQRTDIEDDKYGMLSPIAGQLGQNAAHHPDLLVAQLLKAGHTTPCYTGQNFFDTAQPDFTNSGAATTSPNYVTGSGPAWYLFDMSKVLRAVIFQMRRPYKVLPKFSPTDPNVFWNKEFEWGVDGRANAGFGLWQLGFMSLQALTMENLIAARTQMASYHRPDGAPMGVKGTLLVVPTALFTTAKALAEDQFVPNTMSNTYVTSTTVTNVPNVARGLFTPLENEWLN